MAVNDGLIYAILKRKPTPLWDDHDDQPDQGLMCRESLIRPLSPGWDISNMGRKLCVAHATETYFHPDPWRKFGLQTHLNTHCECNVWLCLTHAEVGSQKLPGDHSDSFGHLEIFWACFFQMSWHVPKGFQPWGRANSDLNPPVPEIPQGDLSILPIPQTSSVSSVVYLSIL